MPSTILSDNGVSSGSAGLKTTASNDGALALQTTTSGGTATTAVTIDTSQNVGIGTSSPAQKLQVLAVNGTGFAGAAIQNQNTNVGIAGVQFSSDTTYFKSAIGHVRNDSNGVGSLVFYNASSTGAANWSTSDARMTLDSSGNLSLLTSGASFSWLDSGNTYLSIGYIGSTNRIQGRAGAAASVPLTFWTNDTERARIDSSGNLMVGNTGGESKFNVLGGGSNGFTSGTLPPGMTIYGNATNGYGSMLSFKPEPGAQGISGIASFRVSGYQTDLRFYTNDTNNGNAFTERARINSSGIFMVGKTTNSATSLGVELTPDGQGGFGNAATSNATITNWVYSTGAGAFRFYVGMAGTVYATSTTITGISDQRLKENIRDLDDGLEKVMALQPRKFDWKEGKGQDIKNARGFIAQEFEQVFPDMVEEWQDPAPEGEEPYKAVNANLIPTLVKALQELNAKVDAQAAEIAALKGN